jgi:hypothetical protein
VSKNSQAHNCNVRYDEETGAIHFNEEKAGYVD